MFGILIPTQICKIPKSMIYSFVYTFSFNNLYRDVRTNPIGCPRDTAPPLMFTLAESRPLSCMLASTTMLKASFTSHLATRSLATPVCCSNWKNSTVVTAAAMWKKSSVVTAVVTGRRVLWLRLQHVEEEFCGYGCSDGASFRPTSHSPRFFIP